MKRNQIKDLKQISSYQLDNIFNVYKDSNGFYFYNMFNSIHIDDDISPTLYKEHVFSEGDYWTKLANNYYGNQKLWWVILAANNINNPLDLPEPGTKLKILNDAVVSHILSQIINGTSN